MSTDPMVSVLMPVRNGERWVRQAVESVLRQTLRSVELIIVDDGSSDRTPEILETLGRRDTRIRVTRQNPDGLVHALNRGLALAAAPLLARLDADDIAEPDRLARQAACFSSDRSRVLLGSWASKIDGEGRVIGRLHPEADAQRLSGILLRRNPFIHSSTMMRTSLVRELGGYRPAFLGAEDYDLWLRISECGTIANLPCTLVSYRVHATSTSLADGLRQCFSARLARAAAAARRTHGVDPADDLRGPPDWWSPEADTSFFAEAAQICRLLDCADRAVFTARHSEAVRTLSAAHLFALSHVETGLAYRSLLNFVMSGTPSASISRWKAATMAATLLLARPFFRR